MFYQCHIVIYIQVLKLACLIKEFPEVFSLYLNDYV